jgi:glutaredoxin-like YruB-family protein
MKVKVYSTQTCPYCHQLKDYLKEKNVDFEDIDVGSNPAKAQEMIDKSGQMGVPVSDIDGEIIIGFDVDAINKKLNLG